MTGVTTADSEGRESVESRSRRAVAEKAQNHKRRKWWVTTEKMLVQGANQNSMATIDTEIAPVAKKECNTIEA